MRLPMAVPLLLFLMVSGPALAGAPDSTNPRSLNGFGVDGVELGMGIERVLEIYPEARVEREAASCFRYGRAIVVPELTRRVLQFNDDQGDLTLNFAPPYAGGGLSRIHFDRPVDPSTFNIRKLLDRFTVRYGAYDRILHRWKMEPAGRIVGFEWRRANGATLRVILRNDYRSSTDHLRLSFLARSPMPEPPIRTQLCGAFRPSR